VPVSRGRCDGEDIGFDGRGIEQYRRGGPSEAEADGRSDGGVRTLAAEQALHRRAEPTTQGRAICAGAISAPVGSAYLLGRPAEARHINEYCSTQRMVVALSTDRHVRTRTARAQVDPTWLSALPFGPTGALNSRLQAAASA